MFTAIGAAVFNVSSKIYSDDVFDTESQKFLLNTCLFSTIFKSSKLPKHQKQLKCRRTSKTAQIMQSKHTFVRLYRTDQIFEQ